MTLRMESITEEEIDKEALNLRASIDRLMDREWLPEMDGNLGFVADQVALGHHWEDAKAGVEKKPLALCVGSGLDFLASNDRVISAKTGRMVGARKKFSAHLALCAVCQMSEECLDVAVRFKERIGIYGGKFPHERRTP